MSAAYPRSQRLLEYAAIALYAALAAWSLWRHTAAAGWHSVTVLLIAAPFGWLAADLLSGLVHWALDSFGSVHTPLVGKSFIRPFREHHVDPNAMTRHDFVETNGASCLGALPLLFVTASMPLAGTAALFAHGLLFAIALGALGANQCHKWAHMEEHETPAWVRWLQRRRLLLSPAQHRLHHTPPFDSHFCTASGWMNAPLDALLRAWR